MGNERLICYVCERALRSNQHAVECSRCCSWLHKGCSKLSDVDFDKIHSSTKRSGAHDWVCSKCSRTEVKRISFGVRDESTSRRATSQQPDTDGASGDVRGTSVLPTTISSESEAMAEANVKNLISTLLRKKDTNNKDIVSLFSKMFDLLICQKSELHNFMNDFRMYQSEKIESMQQEINELRNRLDNLESSHGETNRTNVQNPSDHSVLAEIQERSSRANNIILYNCGESSSEDTAHRIAHDKEKVKNVLSQISVEVEEYKVVRIGRMVNQNSTRPLKVIFSNTNIVSLCLKNKRRLTGNVYLNADLTPLQRQQFKKCQEELRARKANGEQDVMIRHFNGNPKVIKINRRQTDDKKN